MEIDHDGIGHGRRGREQEAGDQQGADQRAVAAEIEQRQRQRAAGDRHQAVAGAIEQGVGGGGVEVAPG
ncbi:hypothetical protein G6F31_018672 [Rhizopus arrhizus]|nr:hypothetical protein G6F31_018672 [Rhizopus arrhizus]